MTPSLPTCFIASARKLPISASPLAEMVPTWAISSFEVTFLEFFCSSATTCSTARSMPRLRSIGFMPAATDLEPSLTIAWASTVAVVVPSPAKSEDFEATSRTIWAPMFSNLSSSSISLATVTPSLVMRGAPNDLSRTTLRPFGPSVTLTALARMSTPRSILSRASTENLTSLAAISIHSVDESLILRRRRPEDAAEDEERFGDYAAFFLATVSSTMPMMSDSFMIRRSWPSILTSVPDHLPNRTRSPTLMSIGMSLPASSRPPGRRRRLHPGRASPGRCRE